MAPWRFLTVHSKTMTVERLVKDGQLQCDALGAVLDDDGLTASKPCIVLVVDEEQCQCRLLLDALAGRVDYNSHLMPLLGVALSEFAARVMKEEPEALAMMGRFYGLSHERRGAKKGLAALLEVLGGKETGDEQ